MNEQDRRFKRTERALKEAVVGLVIEKGYEAVTIREITDRADIAYATFYRHYKTKDELLLEYLGEVIDSIEQTAHDTASEKPFFQLEGELFFAYVQQNIGLFKAIFESRKITRYFVTRLSEHIMQVGKMRLEGLPIPPEIVANHMAASALAMVDWWVQHNQPHPIAAMAAHYEKLVIESVWAVSTE